MCLIWDIYLSFHHNLIYIYINSPRKDFPRLYLSFHFLHFPLLYFLFLACYYYCYYCCYYYLQHLPLPLLFLLPLLPLLRSLFDLNLFLDYCYHYLIGFLRIQKFDLIVLCHYYFYFLIMTFILILLFYYLLFKF